jgi:acyl-CoA synthetase (AMP-forming)/AMP-acid ligase II
MTAIYDASSLWDLVERRAADSPDATFLIEGVGDDTTTLTFREFRDRAERVAAGLAAKGLTEGSSVVWQLPTKVESLVVCMAMARLGVVQTPLIHLYREKELSFCIEAAKPAMVVVPGTFGDHDYVAMVNGILEASGHEAEVLAAFDGLPEGDPATLPPAPSGDGEPVRWIYYTSGTTSDPKGVQHTDHTLMAAGMGLAKSLEVTDADVGSMGFPFAHIAGPDYTIMVLAAGMSVVLLPAFIPDVAVAAFNEHGATIAGGSTVFYTMFLNMQRAQPDTPLIPSLRMLAGGGAPKPPEIYFEVKEEMGIPVAHGYGMTECPMIAQGSPTDADDKLANTDGAPVEGCVIAIVKEDGTVAAAGEEGEVRLEGPMVFKGYTDQAQTDSAFDEAGRFKTGDLGRLDADGHVALTGRLKDLIIRKGENISATEVEDVLYTHPKVGAVAVIGLPDRDRGERVCAVVEPSESGEEITFDELTAHCAEAGLMRQKTPEQLIIQKLPRNDTLQKVLKFKLRDELAEIPWP